MRVHDHLRGLAGHLVPADLRLPLQHGGGQRSVHAGGPGPVLAPVFRAPGLWHWQASTALVTGLTAKEAVVSTPGHPLRRGIPAPSAPGAQLFPLAAMSFLIFTLNAQGGYRRVKLELA